MLNPRQQHTGRVKSTKMVETLDGCGGRPITCSAKLSPVLFPASRRLTIMMSSTQRLRVFEQRLQQQLCRYLHRAPPRICRSLQLSASMTSYMPSVCSLQTSVPLTPCQRGSSRNVRPPFLHSSGAYSICRSLVVTSCRLGNTTL